MRSPMQQSLMKDQLTLYVFVSVLFVVGVVFGVLLVGALTFDQQQNLAGDVQQLVQRIQEGMGADGSESFWERVFFSCQMAHPHLGARVDGGGDAARACA